MNWKGIYTLAVFAGASLLVACGDDDSSSFEEENNSSGQASVETYEDLVHCTKSHYGEIVFVEEENAYFECTSEDWIEVDSATVDSILATSSSSEGTSEAAKSSSSVKADSSEVAKVETKKVDSVTVSGFAQKGPFASGSAVTVYGLDSALEVTKTKFTGKVSGDSGAFKVEKIVLPSQFALVQVSGFYANEISGKNTSGTKTTLNAIVDLSANKSVKANVNLFTELEYARAKHLVTAEKFNVPAAKKRATKELLAIFGAKAGDDLTATDLSLSDTTSAGIAMLAASILLQGDLSASKFGIRLEDVSERFAATGSMDSDTLRADLADWASRADSADNFAGIRANVKNMKLVATVPDFESILYTFWTGVYKLGACTDSLEETIKKNDNKQSDNYGAGYVCTSKHWHKATALDSDLGLCTAKMEGSFKEYKGGKSTEYYVCRTGTWQKITETQFELKECTEKRENEYVKAKSGEYFVCSGKQWIELDSVTYELKLCTEKRKLELAKTEKGDSYVCEWNGNNGNWRKATALEAELGVCGGKNAESGKISKTKSGEYYACSAGEWKKSDEPSFLFGTCDASLKDSVRWSGTFVTNADGKPIGYGIIPLDTAGVTGKYYECNGSEWKESNLAKYVYGVRCTENTITSMVEPGIMSKFIEMKTVDGTSVAKDGVEGLAYLLSMSVILDHDSLNYVQCKNGIWKSIDKVFYDTREACTATNVNTLKDKYACVLEDGEYHWREQTPAELANGAFCTAELADDSIHNGYVCEKNGNVYAWRDLTDGEAANKALCSSKWNDKVVHNGYVCEALPIYAWRRATTAEIATGKVCEVNAGRTEILNGYVCQYGDTNWRAASSVELETDTVCGMFVDIYYNTGAGSRPKQVTTSGDHLFAGKYVCSQRGPCVSNKIRGYCWREASASEKRIGQPCFAEKYKQFALWSDDMYRCTDTTAFMWSKWTYQTIKDTRDGRNDSYRIVDIGDTVVMVDNLKFRHAEDSLANWKCYENLSANCDKYGAMYIWSAAVSGACPDGWHVPSQQEGTWLWNQITTEGKGFPQYMSESYDPEPGGQMWWTSSSKNSSQAYIIGFTSSHDNYALKDNFLYLRCIKNRQ